MRIAILTTTFPAVSQTFIVNQITGLIDLGHDVRIFPLHSEDDGKALSELGQYDLAARTQLPELPRLGRIGRMGQALGSALRYGLRYPRQVVGSLDVRTLGAEALSGKAMLEAAFFLEQDFRPDVIYCHFGPNGLRGLSLRRRGLLSGKLVTVFHAYDLTRYVRDHGEAVYRALFDEGDLFLPITAYAAEKLRGLGCPPQRMRVHPMGVDCERFAPGELGVASSGPLHVLSVGRLVEKKGFEYALEAMRLLAKQGVNVRYTILGGGVLETQLRDLSERLGLQDRVVFLGSQGPEVVRQELMRCDLMLAPSVTAMDGDEEGLPVVLMEAMAAGKPVISTRHAAIPELVEDGVTGMLVEERDVAGMAEHLARLHRDRELLAALGQQGRAKVVEEFNVKRLNPRLAALLAEAACG